MKTKLRKIIKGATIGLSLIALAISASSCVSTYTKVTSPDGTITETSTKGPDAASVNIASAVAAAAIRIRYEK